MTSAKASEAKKHIAGFLLSVTAAAGAAVLCAAPVIDQQTVRLTQDESTGLVTVQYVLTGDPAVVTVDFRTNDVATGTWASIGDGKFAHVKGDVNKLVTAVDTTCSIFWQPGGPDAWPGHRVPGAGFKAVVSAWSTNAPPPYMIVDLKNGSGRTWYYNSAEAIPFGITNDLYKTDRLAFRLVPGRDVQWLMGSPEGETGVSKAGNEARHLVKFTKDWYMGVYPVTQAQNVFLADGIAQGNRSNRLLRPRPSAVTNDLPDTATFPVDSVGWTSLRGY